MTKVNTQGDSNIDDPTNQHKEYLQEKKEFMENRRLNMAKSMKINRQIKQKSQKPSNKNMELAHENLVNSQSSLYHPLFKKNVNFHGKINPNDPQHPETNIKFVNNPDLIELALKKRVIIF